MGVYVAGSKLLEAGAAAGRAGFLVKDLHWEVFSLFKSFVFGSVSLHLLDYFFVRVAGVKIKAFTAVKVVNSYPCLAGDDILLESVRPIHKLPVQIIFSINILMKIQFDNFKIAMFQIIWVLIGQIMIPKYYKKLLWVDIFVKSRLHVANNSKFWRVSHIVEYHLAKYVVWRVTIPFIKDFVVHMVNASLLLRNRLFHFSFTYIKKLFSSTCVIRVKVILPLHLLIFIFVRAHLTKHLMLTLKSINLYLLIELIKFFPYLLIIKPSLRVLQTLHIIVAISAMLQHLIKLHFGQSIVLPRRSVLEVRKCFPLSLQVDWFLELTDLLLNDDATLCSNGCDDEVTLLLNTFETCFLPLKIYLCFIHFTELLL